MPVEALRDFSPDVLARHDAFHHADFRWRQAAERWSTITGRLFEPALPRHLSADFKSRPSLLLRADVAAVPFRGRQDEITDLINWCTGPAHLDVRLVTGSGGTGKTRLALELMAELRANGWLAGFLRRDIPLDALRALVDTKTPVLLALDYAEARSIQCGELLEQLVGVDRAEPMRVLMLARAAGEWWNELTTLGPRVEVLLHDVVPIAIPVLESDLDGRQDAYEDAMRTFARKLGLATPAVQLNLSDDRHGLPLDLHMAALVTLLAGTSDKRSRDNPIDYLLKHERRYWRQSAGERGLTPGDPVLERVMTAATLCRATTEERAAALLSGVPDLAGADPGQRHQYARWAHEINPDPVHYLAPLQPDRIGEHLVVQAVTRMPGLLTALLSQADNEQADHALAVVLRTYRQMVHTAADDAAVSRFTDTVSAFFSDRPDVLQRMVIDRATAYYAAEVAEATRLSSAYSQRYLRHQQPSLDALYVELAAVPSADRSTGSAALSSIVRAHHRTYLRGPAGSGKTTFLLWLARRTADRTVNLDGHDVVPFYIPLRLYGSDALPSPDQFADHLGRNFRPLMPARWAHDLLDNGHALLLIDGVDELPEPRRQAVHSWLDDLISVFPDARYVVATRPVLASDWLSPQGFASFDLVPLTASGSAVMIERWFEALDEDGAEAPADELLRELRYNSQLLKMAENPLLCTLLCQLWAQARYLPHDVARLHREVVEMLLTSWDAARHISFVVGRDVARLVLQRLAYWQLRNQSSEISIDTARILIGKALRDGGDDVDADDVLRTITERTGLLAVSGRGALAFAYRGVRDFLAAREILVTGDLPALVEHAHLDHWHEVIVMVSRMALPAENNRLVRALLDGNESTRGDASARDQLVRLAAECAENAELDPELRAAVLEAEGRLTQRP